MGIPSRNRDKATSKKTSRMHTHSLFTWACFLLASCLLRGCLGYGKAREWIDTVDLHPQYPDLAALQDMDAYMNTMKSYYANAGRPRYGRSVRSRLLDGLRS